MKSFLTIIASVMIGTSPAWAASSKLSGAVKIDGSSTVFPITEAVAEEFQKLNPGVRVTVGISGTGGGFKKFTHGETDVSNASRPISDSEREGAAKNKIEFIELPVAFDGLSVVVNPKNSFVTTMTVAELKKIWEPGSTVKMWSDVRPSWPKEKINLYGPGADSGTFDYFTEAVVGKAKSIRADFTASEDDNTLVQGVSGDKNALGYFGYAYYVENKDKLKVIAIDNGKGGVLPSEESIRNGSYAPLARPLLVYASTTALKRSEVQAFVEFYLAKAEELVPEVKYVPLSKAIYAAARERLKTRKVGSVFGTHQLTAKMEDLLKMEAKK